MRVSPGTKRSSESSFVAGIFSVHLYTSPFFFGGLEKTRPSFLAIRQCHVTGLGHRIMNNMGHFRAKAMRNLCVRGLSFFFLESANVRVSCGHGLTAWRMVSFKIL